MTSAPAAPDTWFDTCAREADPVQAGARGPFHESPFPELAADGIVVAAIALPVTVALLSGALSRMFLIAGAVLPLLYAAALLLAALHQGRLTRGSSPLTRVLLVAARLLPAAALSAAVLVLAFTSVPQVGAALLLLLTCGAAVAWGCCAVAVEERAWRLAARWRARRAGTAGATR